MSVSSSSNPILGRITFGTTSTATLDVGSGVPTGKVANKGSLWLRTDGSTNTRIYFNTDGDSTWAAVTSA